MMRKSKTNAVSDVELTFLLIMQSVSPTDTMPQTTEIVRKTNVSYSIR